MGDRRGLGLHRASVAMVVALLLTAATTVTSLAPAAAGGLPTALTIDGPSVAPADMDQTRSVTATFEPSLVIATGAAHTCAVLSVGTVRCWGWNVSGQLGDGTKTSRLTPTPVSGLSGVVAISAGWYHTCALLSGGTVRCWGHNRSGQLGDGTTTDRSTPTPVSALSGVVAISAGGHHTCAVLGDGTVRCWGSNYYGQLGDGIVAYPVTPAPVSNSTASRSTPTPVIGLIGVVAISAGGFHTCAVLSDGIARCWGDNRYGQLGDGTTTRFYPSTSIPVSALSGVVAISGGDYHTCAVLSDATARCWGSNYYRQLGDGTTTDRSSPTPVSALSGVLAISAGASHTCAVLSDGTGNCWGFSEVTVGNTTTTRLTPPTPVSGLSGATAISAGSAYTCAVLSDNTVRCWGDNQEGQLGDGTTTDRATPGPAVDLS